MGFRRSSMLVILIREPHHRGWKNFAATVLFFSPLRGSLAVHDFTHGLRRGLYSCAASRLSSHAVTSCPRLRTHTSSYFGLIMSGRPTAGHFPEPVSYTHLT